MIPTVGFNMKKVTKGNVTIKMWDIGGQTRFRSMWERYCRGVNAIVYVVDSADKEKFELSRKELHELLTKPPLAGIPLLVLGNKNDLPEAVSVDELIEAMFVVSYRNQHHLLLLFSPLLFASLRCAAFPFPCKIWLAVSCVPPCRPQSTRKHQLAAVAVAVACLLRCLPFLSVQNLAGGVLCSTLPTTINTETSTPCFSTVAFCFAALPFDVRAELTGDLLSTTSLAPNNAETSTRCFALASFSSASHHNTRTAKHPPPCFVCQTTGV